MSNSNTDTIYLESSLPDVDMEESIHYGTGVSHFLSESILVKTEVFYKKYNQLSINTANYPLEEYKNVGQGKAGGIELMIQKFSGKIEGWLTYTQSKTRRNNQEGWFTPEYDVLHMANLYADINIKKLNVIK